MKKYLIRIAGYLLAVEPWLFIMAFVLGEPSIDMASVWKLFGMFNLAVPLAIGLICLNFWGWHLLLRKNNPGTEN